MAKVPAYTFFLLLRKFYVNFQANIKRVYQPEGKYVQDENGVCLLFKTLLRHCGVNRSEYMTSTNTDNLLSFIMETDDLQNMNETEEVYGQSYHTNSYMSETESCYMCIYIVYIHSTYNTV